MTRLSAIVACYRDGPAIIPMYERLCAIAEEISVELEVVFVNDASPDDAENILRDLAAKDRRVVAVNHSRNFGSQAAFTSGMRVCTGDIVVLMDGDLQDPPEVIRGLYEKWKEGYDVVYGVRVKRDASLFLQASYKIFYRLLRRLSYLDIPCDAGDFSLLDRKVVAALEQFPERDRFLRGLRAYAGFRQIGVPYVRPERMFGRTTNNLFKNIAWARKGILSFSYRPLEWISWIALIVTAAAVSAIFYYLGRYLFVHDAPRGFTTLLLAVLFLGGMQLLCLAIIGDYVGRIFEEVKQRPLYLVKSIFNDPRARD
ncbi:MAG TPA: glycosyltransferase family 2 protein [Myxococcales bacterium]|nr:glycosyltransferase family 2 protein [Myxococcales bacterium]